MCFSTVSATVSASESSVIIKMKVTAMMLVSLLMVACSADAQGPHLNLFEKLQASISNPSLLVEVDSTVKSPVQWRERHVNQVLLHGTTYFKLA
jgi:hypothetical protein